MARLAECFDLQVNGAAGVSFNGDALTADSLHSCCEAIAASGTEGFLATIITADLDAMVARIRRLVELRRQDPLARAMIAGLHIEGPFISPVDGYRGAHPLPAVRPADLAAAGRLIDAGDGLVSLFTLAPEQDAGQAVTRWLADQGILVAAGHTDADLDTLHAAVDAGLSVFTHLGNGCPAQMPRHDNILQRVLSLDSLRWVTLIADGVHLPPFVLGNCLRTLGLDRAVIVSDAMQAAGLGPGRYTLHGFDVLVGDDLAAWAPDRSHLLGSARLLGDCGDTLRSIGLSDTAIGQLTAVNPRRAMGLLS